MFENTLGFEQDRAKMLGYIAEERAAYVARVSKRTFTEWCVKAYQAQFPDEDHVSETDEEDAQFARSPSASPVPWSDDEAREAGVMHSK